METIALHKDISALPIRCSEDCPKIIVFDNQKDGYSLKIKKNLARECCHGCCVRELLESRGLRVTEDEKFLTFQ